VTRWHDTPTLKQPVPQPDLRSNRQAQEVTNSMSIETLVCVRQAGDHRNRAANLDKSHEFPCLLPNDTDRRTAQWNPAPR
jgi:hypothetical protein